MLLIEALAVQSLLHNAEGNTQAAVADLERAIRLAEPAGFIRLFADLGPRLDPMLARLAWRGVAPTYIEQIGDATTCAACGRCEGGRGYRGRPHTASQLAPAPRSVEMLTHREMDVLQLLMQRLTNKEIGRELGISPRP